LDCDATIAPIVGKFVADGNCAVVIGNFVVDGTCPTKMDFLKEIVLGISAGVGVFPSTGVFCLPDLHFLYS
ncbi:MAG: hypothetical protein II757_04375, partial [Bacteroidales bacterium]|nr:hypothetical protein [Bacteroidales bacterium]